MKTITMALLAAASALSLGACATGYYHGGGYVDGYYDDYYGGVYDGYWGPDAVFYYRSGPSEPYHRDDGGHFRHDASDHFHPVHVRAGHDHGDHGDHGDRRDGR
jgi:hypothetical protein